jgi:uncharacterized membrane protein YbhN (UPF0104 family)
MTARHSAAVRRAVVSRSVLGPLAALAVAFLAVSQLSGLPARLLAACLGWMALAGVLELLSIAGFVLVFNLVFGVGLSWRQSLPAGLRGLAASTLLPAGGLIGPAAAARAAHPHDVPLRVTTRSAIAFLILTAAPGVFVLGGLGLLVWERGAAGPHKALLTLVPAGVAFALILTTWLVRDPGPRDPIAIRGGAAEAHRLLASFNWQLVGALAYYAGDNAVLWATFHAYGHAQPLSIIAMGYLLGSLTGALPLPAGLGITEGGIIGALVLYGAPAAPATGAVLLYRAVSLSLPVILGVVGCRGSLTHPPPTRAARSRGPLGRAVGPRHRPQA